MDFKTVEKNGSLVLAKVLNDEEKVIVPELIDGKTVVGVGKGCFKGKTKIKSIVFPDTITKIEINAFEGCTALESIKMPAYLKNIGKSAFKDCDNLKSIYIDSKNFKMTEDVFVDAPSSFCIKLPKRLTGDNDWTSNLWKGQLFLGTDPLESIISGYDIKYDSDYHEVKKTEDGIVYFINEDGKLVIGHDKEPYDFKRKNIVIPSKIDGKPVYAIGTEAFKGASFDSLVLPDSIKVISAHAFYQAGFNYIKLPNELEYLNNCVFGGIFILANAFNIQKADDYSLWSRFIIMPKKIKTLDLKSLDQPYETHFIFGTLIVNDGDSKIKIIDKEIHYDETNRLIYIIDEFQGKDSIFIISAPGFKVEALPKEIEGKPVVGWDVTLLDELIKEIPVINEDYVKEHSEDTGDGIKVDFEDEADNDNFLGKLFTFVAINDEVVIPSYIRNIISIFDKYFTLDKESKVIFHDSFVSLEGICFKYPYFVPKSIKHFRYCCGTVFIEEGSSLDSSEDDLLGLTVKEHCLSVEEKDDYKYVVFDNKGNKEAYLYQYNGHSEDITLDLTNFDGYEVTGCRLHYESKVSRFTLIFDKLDQIDSLNGYKLSFEKDLEYIAIGGSKKIYDLEKIIRFAQFMGCPRYEILEGVEELLDQDGVPLFNIDSGDSTLHLPKSLRRIGHLALFATSFKTLEVHQNTIIDSDALPSDCQVIEYNDDGLISNSSSSNDGALTSEFVFDDDENETFEISEEEVESSVIPRTIVNDILDYDLDSDSLTMVNRGREVLNQNKLSSVEVDNGVVRAYCSGSAGERYNLFISQRSNGKLDYSCTCPSFRNGMKGSYYSRLKCKHIYALMLYIKKYYGEGELKNPSSNYSRPVTSSISSSYTPKTTSAVTSTPTPSTYTSTYNNRDSILALKMRLMTYFSLGAMVCLLVSLIAMLSTKGTVSYYFLDSSGQIVSRLVTSTLHFKSYFNGFSIFLFIVALLGSLSLSLVARKKKFIGFGMVLTVIFNVVALCSFFSAKERMYSYMPKTPLPSETILITSRTIQTGYIVGVIFAIIGLLLNIAATVFFILDFIRDKEDVY